MISESTELSQPKLQVRALYLLGIETKLGGKKHNPKNPNNNKKEPAACWVFLV